MSNYYEDEYYEEDPEPEYMGGALYVCKAANGQLYAKSVDAFNDGVHIDPYYWAWYTTRCSLRDLNDKAREVAVMRGAPLEPGESVDISDWWQYDDEPEEDDWHGDLEERDEASHGSDDVSDIPF